MRARAGALGRAAWARAAVLPRRAQLGLAAGLLAVLAVVAVLLASGGGPLASAPPPPALADPVPYDGRSPLEPAGARQRVLVELPRPALGRLPGAREMGAAAQRAYLDSLAGEAAALRSALTARGVRFAGVVTFGRAWNGFAATVPTRDLAKLTSFGVRGQPVRRFYPAVGEPVPVGGPPAPLPVVPPESRAPVALLDTGVAPGGLKGRLARGFDVVDRDRDPAPGPDPRDTTRVEASGTALAGVLAAAGERVLPIRIASLRAAGAGPGGAAAPAAAGSGAAGTVEAVATTDQLLAGLERAVDPNGDGDTSDHVPVALVGVDAPFAGFGSSPEAGAVRGAAGLGTLVVAPAGNTGASGGESGTIGAPGAAPGALTTGALAGLEPAPRVSVEAGDVRVSGAAVLAGAPPRAGALRTAGPVAGDDPAALARRGAGRLTGRVVLVRAGVNPPAQAAAAAAAGARAVVLADPRERPLPAVPAGRAGVAVVGLTGAGARAVLAVPAGTRISFGPVRRGAREDGAGRPRLALYGAGGPTLDGALKPDLAAPGSALTLAPGAAAAVAGGTAIAAARVAAAAAALQRAQPDDGPGALRAALMGAADPGAGPVVRTGAGALRPRPPQDAVTARPASLASRGGARGTTLRLRLTARSSGRVRLDGGPATEVRPAAVRLTAGRPRSVRLRVARSGAGRLLVRDARGAVVASVPWLVTPREAVGVPLGPLRLTGPTRRPDGVRFTLGGFSRGDPLHRGARVEVADRLVLELVTASGAVAQRLTPPGGARELMPAEYGYTLPRAALDALPAGRYAFRARAWAPGQAAATEGRSAAFAR